MSIATHDIFVRFVPCYLFKIQTSHISFGEDILKKVPIKKSKKRLDELNIRRRIKELHLHDLGFEELSKEQKDFNLNYNLMMFWD